MELTAEQITGNFDQILQIINNVFTGERKEKLLVMFNELSERFMLAPASSINYFHYAFPGGLCLHTLNVMRIAKKLYELWKDEGANVSDYSFETLIFCSLVHDLGKVGNELLDFYVPNDSDWHIKNQGKIYKLNPALHNMRHSDRSIYLLNYFGVKISELEYITIIIHDGPLEPSTPFYFSTFEEGKILKSNLPYILHMADLTAYRLEHEEYINKPKVPILKKKDEKREVFSKMDIEKTFESLFPGTEVK